MFFTIYKITNKINSQTYIGKHQTNDLNDDYFGSGKLLKRAIKKHGLENFTKEILFVFDNEIEMNYKERELVEVGPNSYNLCEGGKGGFGYINSKGLNKSIKQKEASKKIFQKNSKNHLEKIQNDKIYYNRWVRNLQEGCIHSYHLGRVNGFKGRKHSLKTKTKMSLSKKGKNIGTKNSQYGSFWITNNLENKKLKKGEIIPEGWIKGRKFFN